MRYSRQPNIALAFMCFLLTPYLGFAQQSTFDEAVIDKWKAYELFSRRLQGHARVNGTLQSGAQYQVSYAYKQNRECASFSKVPKLTDPNIESWFICNPRYAARIKRNKEKPDDVVLLGYTDDRNTPMFGGKLSILDAVFLETSPHFSFNVFRLSELALDPEFKAKRAGKVSSNGRELIQVDYAFDQQSPGDKLQQTKTHGSIYFDPSRSWCIDRVQRIVQTINKGKIEMDGVWDERYETYEHSSGYPLIKRRIHHTKILNLRNDGSSKETHAESTTDYEWETNENVPDSEFTLSAFGLPEPGSDTIQKRTPLYVWILLGAGACVLLAFGFRYLARRRGRIASAP